MNLGACMKLLPFGGVGGTLGGSDQGVSCKQ